MEPGWAVRLQPDSREQGTGIREQKSAARARAERVERARGCGGQGTEVTFL